LWRPRAARPTVDATVFSSLLVGATNAVERPSSGCDTTLGRGVDRAAGPRLLVEEEAARCLPNRMRQRWVTLLRETASATQTTQGTTNNQPSRKHQLRTNSFPQPETPNKSPRGVETPKSPRTDKAKEKKPGLFHRVGCDCFVVLALLTNDLLAADKMALVKVSAQSSSSFSEVWRSCRSSGMRFFL
jgi:hypothetical protein